MHEQYESDSYYTIAFKNKAEDRGALGLSVAAYPAQPAPLHRQAAPHGCGRGQRVLRLPGPQRVRAQADGLEISDAESAYAREMFGVDFIRSDLAHVDGKYDVLTSFNVIEHVPNPAALLAGMRERLNDGGYLIVTTPNPSCIHRRILGLQKWNMVAPPHHINLFTRAALEQMLKQRRLRSARIQHDQHVHQLRAIVRHEKVCC